jgi:hypothetical protein
MDPTSPHLVFEGLRRARTIVGSSKGSFESLKVSFSEGIKVICVYSVFLGSRLPKFGHHIRIRDALISDKSPRPYRQESIKLLAERMSERLTSVKFLCADADYFKRWMCWDVDFLIQIIRSWHPK